MTEHDRFKEWWDQGVTGSDQWSTLERLSAKEAWLARAEIAKTDQAGWVDAAYADGGLDAEAKCREEIVRMREALEEIRAIFTVETDPTRACHKIQAIVKRGLGK